MARTKGVPLRRVPSDFNQGLPENPDYGYKHTDRKANGIASPAGVGNGHPIAPSPSIPQEQAGLAQLVICVAGIYASL